jgi:hypothetical protein
MSHCEPLSVVFQTSRVGDRQRYTMDVQTSTSISQIRVTALSPYTYTVKPWEHERRLFFSYSFQPV